MDCVCLGWLTFLVICSYKGCFLLFTILIINTTPSASDIYLLFGRRYGHQIDSKDASNSTTLPKAQHTTKMYTKAILIAAFSVLATASPINVSRPGSTGVETPFPIGSGTPPKGFTAPSGAPYPTAVPVPRPSGDKSDCPVNGQLVCNGPSQWGLCNWGKVQFQPVAAGTQCLDGEIVFAQGFGTNA